MSSLKKTPLNEAHLSLGAKMVPFAGWEMPVSYSGIIEEHVAVRERAGVFDVSHMGEFIVSGPDALAFVDRAVTNNCAKLPGDGVLYSVMCRENGTVVDDVLVTRLADDRYMIVVNAANIQKDWSHLSALAADGRDDIALEDASDRTALIAVQGPGAEALLRACPTFSADEDKFDRIGYYRYFTTSRDGHDIIVSRTGYTGERGFELFLPAESAMDVWNEVLRAGSGGGVVPVGLAARDTLRFEASFCLYGHELDDETSPLEAGLRWLVKLRKPDFVGKDALVRESKQGSRRRLVGLSLEGKNIARQGYVVMKGAEVVGRVTSGTFSPTLKRSLCMAYIDTDSYGDDERYAVQVRKKTVPATLTPLPFYPSRARE